MLGLKKFIVQVTRTERWKQNCILQLQRPIHSRERLFHQEAIPLLLSLDRSTSAVQSKVLELGKLSVTPDLHVTLCPTD